MSLTIDDIASAGWARKSPLSKSGRTVGPVTAAKQRRTLTIYLAMCAIGLAPWLLHGSAAQQAAGLGLWFPGAGFLADGGWAMLLTPVTLALFALALFAWFGAGMVIAPGMVWLGAAFVAGMMAPAHPSTTAAAVVPALVATFAAWTHARESKKRQAGVAMRQARQAAIPAAIAAAFQASGERPEPGSRELSADDLASVRYVLDRALQPVDRFDGFDIIDQFQTSSLRYQINHMGYALAEMQAHYTPNFRGYLGQAQRNLIEKYLQKKVWTYWLYETAWGHLNLTNFDPAGKDNIMLTGWLGLHVGMYQMATGDRRYEQPGALTFRLNKQTAWAHSLHSLNDSVRRNYQVAPFCLYPCEPNWVYPICNHYGMACLTVNDALFGSQDVTGLIDRWMANLDAEFTDESGSIVGLRSSLTGLRFPFPGGELGFATFQNAFAPERAWRSWAVARGELQYILAPSDDGPRFLIPGRGFDFGNYRSGFGTAYASMLGVAREFGDEEMAAAAQRALDQDAAPVLEDGVLRYDRMSNLGNITAVAGRLRRKGDFRATIVEGPPKSARQGPMLEAASYPEVLVAKAFSRGDDLELVLYNGRQTGPQTLDLSQLRPNARYSLAGGGEVTADAQGRARIEVALNGRTEVRLTPVAA